MDNKRMLLINIIITSIIMLIISACGSIAETLDVEPYPAPDVYREYLPAVYRDFDPPWTSAKKGLALACSPYADIYAMGVAWYYNWAPAPPVFDGVEAVPMIWDETHISDTVGGNSEYLLTFNEPDRSDQANISPADAVPYYRELELLYPNRLLVSPVPSHTDIYWLDRFRQAYIAQYGAPPRFDALAAHCYTVDANSCIALLVQFVAWAEAWDVPEIWLTEFAIMDNEYNQPAEAWKLSTWLEYNPVVTHYAWFTNRAGCGSHVWGDYYDQAALVTDDGIMTVIGDVYRDLPDYDR